MFFVIEGTDAAGKQTQTRLLVEHFSRLGFVATSMSFPRYNTPLGAAILRHLKSEIATFEIGGRLDTNDPPRTKGHAPEDAMLFQCAMAVDKYDAVAEIRRGLRDGILVCDRYWPSAFAYGAADGLSKEWLLSIHAELPVPDYLFFIDVSPEEAERRRPGLRDRYEKDRDKQVAVRANYRDLWTAPRPDSNRWKIIDGSGTPEEVHDLIWTALAEWRNQTFVG